MVNLLKTLDKWIVIFQSRGQTVNEKFITIEMASDFLLNLGIEDDSIDDAIIDMCAKQHSRAVFDKDGIYSHTLFD